MMSRKHYIAIARAISDTGGPYESPEVNRVIHDVRNYIAHEIADMCVEDNPNFDYGRFITACNLNV